MIHGVKRQCLELFCSLLLKQNTCTVVYPGKGGVDTFALPCLSRLLRPWISGATKYATGFLPHQDPRHHVRIYARISAT